MAWEDKACKSSKNKTPVVDTLILCPVKMMSIYIAAQSDNCRFHPKGGDGCILSECLAYVSNSV